MVIEIIRGEPVKIVSATKRMRDGVVVWDIEAEPRAIRGGHERTTYTVPADVLPTLRIVD